jgi:hypothetical protein
MVCLQRMFKIAAHGSDRHSGQIQLAHRNGWVPHYVASTSDGVCVCMCVCVCARARVCGEECLIQVLEVYLRKS